MSTSPYKLIVENDFWGNYEVLTENTQGKPRQIRLKGPFMRAEAVNLNKRKYKYENMKENADRFRKYWIDEGRAFGELEHPDYGYINSKQAAQLIISLEEDDNKTWIGESVILCSDPSNGILGTPMGDIAAAIIQRGGKLGQSTRGVGRLSEGNTVEDYQLSTIDIVSDPSIGDFVDGILETKDFMITCHGVVCEMNYERLQGKLSKLPNHERNQYVESAIKDFLKGITMKNDHNIFKEAYILSEATDYSWEDEYDNVAQNADKDIENRVKKLFTGKTIKINTFKNNPGRWVDETITVKSVEWNPFTNGRHVDGPIFTSTDGKKYTSSPNEKIKFMK